MWFFVSYWGYHTFSIFSFVYVIIQRLYVCLFVPCHAFELWYNFANSFAYSGFPVCLFVPLYDPKGERAAEDGFDGCNVQSNKKVNYIDLDFIVMQDELLVCLRFDFCCWVATEYWVLSEPSLTGKNWENQLQLISLDLSFYQNKQNKVWQNVEVEIWS